MTITAAGIAGSTGYASSTSGTRSVGSLTAGQLLVVPVGRYSATSQIIVVGDLTQTAGSATLGTISLDAVQNYDASGGSVFANTAIFSAIVTGSGTCTLTLAGQPSGSFFDIGSEAFNGSWDSSRVETSINTGNDGGTPTVNIASGNVTSAGAALFVGVFDDTTGATGYTRDGAFTQLHLDVGSPNNSGSEYRIVTTGTTDSVDWTANTTINFSAVAVVYKEAGGGGGGGNVLMGQVCT